MFIKWEKETETKAHVIFIHYQPEELPEETLKTGLLVESIPEPKRIEGKRSKLYINLQTKELFYEYIEREKTKEEQLQEQLKNLEEQNATLTLALIEKGVI